MSTAVSLINLNQTRTPRGEYAKPSLRLVRHRSRVLPSNGLREFMFQHHVSEVELSRASGLEPATINRLRNGRVKWPTVPTAWKIVLGFELIFGRVVEFKEVWSCMEVSS